MNGDTGFCPLWNLELVFCQDQARGLVLNFGAGEKAVIRELRNCLPRFDKFARVQEGKIYGKYRLRMAACFIYFTDLCYHRMDVLEMSFFFGKI